MKRSRYSEKQVAYALRLAEGGTPVVHDELAQGADVPGADGVDQ